MSPMDVFKDLFSPRFKTSATLITYLIESLTGNAAARVTELVFVYGRAE